MQTTETEAPEFKQQQAHKPIISADGIITAMSGTFAQLESRYTVTAANTRGALHTMLYHLDKDSSLEDTKITGEQK